MAEKKSISPGHTLALSAQEQQAFCRVKEKPPEIVAGCGVCDSESDPCFCESLSIAALADAAEGAVAAENPIASDHAELAAPTLTDSVDAPSSATKITIYEHARVSCAPVAVAATQGGEVADTVAVTHGSEVAVSVAATQGSEVAVILIAGVSRVRKAWNNLVEGKASLASAKAAVEAATHKLGGFVEYTAGLDGAGEDAAKISELKETAKGKEHTNLVESIARLGTGMRMEQEKMDLLAGVYESESTSTVRSDITSFPAGWWCLFFLFPPKVRLVCAW
jgi:hypothetical protein